MKKIILILVVFILGITGTVLALSTDQQSFIDSQLANYRQSIAENPELFDTPESIDMYYSYIRGLLQYKINTLNGVIAQLPPPTTTTPINGLCNNATQFACSAGTSSANNAGSCGGSSTWSCLGSGGGSDVTTCSKANAACTTPINGLCNNATQFACSAGTSSANNAGSCGGSSTWSCLGSGDGSDSPTCTKANAACAVTTFTVTYNANGGTLDGDSSYTIPQNSVINYFPSVSKPGHHLEGWYTQPIGGTKFTNGTIITQNITYYAHWASYACRLPRPTYSHATFTEGTPNQVDQAWQKGATSCGFTCTNSYEGNTCEIPPPPPEPTCEGPHPAAIPGQLEVYPYSSSTAGPGAGTANTVYRYGYGSCGWVCIAPRVRNGDTGCKMPDPGSGITVHITDAATGAGFGGVQVIAGIAGMNVSRTIATETTNSMGDTNEFWLGKDHTSGWTSIEIIKPGYKILKADGCTARVYEHGGKQVNFCINSVDGTNLGRVNITLIPGDITTSPITVWTDRSLTSSKSVYTYGETLYGYIRGGDPYDTWACLDGPAAGNSCSSWADYRKLGEESIDGWQVNLITGNIEFNNGLFIASGYEPGVYTGYAKTGHHGTNITSTSFTLQ